ncbi:Protein BIM1 [Yarrowia sp. C11]|nr:Protein BIM1 [Yarrowia sp. E02]KAG5369828.1 Protein BIM1 [Yarrowia sp. C11]
MSRQELVQWVNELLQTEISKVEECGKGAIYCQILDSIYGDVPMSKVKFNVKAEYEFLNNYKVLQGVFNRHKIDRQIPVEKLVKCRFQDNLEFLQYCKKHWDANWSGQEYDAVGRRAGRVATVSSIGAAPAGGAGLTSGRTSVQSQTSGRSSVVRSRPSMAATTTPASGRNSVSRRPMAGAGGSQVSNAALTKAQQQIATLEADAVEYQQVLEGLETERNFYFNKLREIEVLVQENAEQMDQVQVEGMIREIQTILYSTEEGFQVPEEEEVF